MYKYLLESLLSIIWGTYLAMELLGNSTFNFLRNHKTILRAALSFTFSTPIQEGSNSMYFQVFSDSLIQNNVDFNYSKLELFFLRKTTKEKPETAISKDSIFLLNNLNNGR